MTTGEMAYLGLVGCTFFAFMGTLGFISIWSRKPKASQPAQSRVSQQADVTSTLRKAA